ncbi:maleylpyruvate isomerase family mycothiol-dependent enzyme [Actinomycetes bacterium KLBMP 9797]
MRHYAPTTVDGVEDVENEEATMDGTHPRDLLADHALDACSPAEAASVERHVAHCPTCAAELDRFRRTSGWLSPGPAPPLPAGLRAGVFAAARAARPPDRTVLVELYSVQLAAFAELLAELSPAQWAAPVGGYATVRHLVAHLADNDALVTSGLGLDPAPVTTDVAHRWRRQATDLVHAVGRADPAVLDREVLLAGGAVRHPLRGALTQRAFETWIHADDIRTSLQLAERDPTPAQLRHVIAFASRLLPGALDTARRGRPGQSIRLALTGPGGEERSVALSAAVPPTGDTAALATVSTSAVAFCRLLAGRRTPDTAGVTIDGDARAARDFLAVVVTMGCD